MKQNKTEIGFENILMSHVGTDLINLISENLKTKMIMTNIITFSFTDLMISRG